MDFRHLLCSTLICLAQAFPEPTVGQSDALLGLPPLESRAHRARARLGERLFFDQRLSAGGAVSCGTCHIPTRAFSDGKSRAEGHKGMRGTRNAPTLLNVAYMQTLFWDGRASDLAQQARAPFVNPVEHALTDESALTRMVSADESYKAEFARLWPESEGNVRPEMITTALADYERTLLSGGSPFDRFFYGNDTTAMSDAAIRGFELFRDRANCASCHLISKRWSLFTDQAFHVAARGIPPSVSSDLPALARQVMVTTNSDDRRDLERLIATDVRIAELGRFLVTLDPAHVGMFKTPSLRNVALTAPYMHDGSAATLAEAVDLELYNRGSVTYPIILTRAEKADLIEFLEALSSVAETSR